MRFWLGWFASLYDWPCVRVLQQGVLVMVSTSYMHLIATLQPVAQDWLKCGIVASAMAETTSEHLRISLIQYLSRDSCSEACQQRCTK